MEESGDLRVPLAFLIGRLDFRRDFKEFQARPEGADVDIVALPKSDRTPFEKVEFVVAPDAQIKRVVVTGQDQSVMDFQFSNEKLNPPLEAKVFKFQAPAGAEFARSVQQTRRVIRMAEFMLRYADARGEVHQQVAGARSEDELREKYEPAGVSCLLHPSARRSTRAFQALRRQEEAEFREVPDLQPAVRHANQGGTADPEGARPAGGPADGPETAPYVNSVRDDVKCGSLLSDAFAKQGIFPPIYVTSVLAGEKIGALAEVLDRFIRYQRLAWRAEAGHGVADLPDISGHAGRRPDHLSGDLRGAELREAVRQHVGESAADDADPDRGRHHGPELHRGGRRRAGRDGRCIPYLVARRGRAERLDTAKLKTPILGEIWIKYQVAQLSRVLGRC